MIVADSKGPCLLHAPERIANYPTRGDLGSPYQGHILLFKLGYPVNVKWGGLQRGKIELFLILHIQTNDPTDLTGRNNQEQLHP